MPIYVRIVKRLMDIIISSVFLILTSPILILISFLIKLDSNGPIIYTQKRLKSSDKEFNIFKFRTMYTTAESNGIAVNAVSADPRVTRIGKTLRKYRIDEIPNFINVLIGDMSVVGPRADRREIFNELKDLPVWNRTQYTKPGITGEAQLSLNSDGNIPLDNNKLYQCLTEKERNSPVDSMRFKLYYDYAYNIKLTKFTTFIVTDIMIMLRTPYVMFFRRNTI